MDNKCSLNVYLLYLGSFPIGMAQTNRIISYARGFHENNAFVKILCMKPSEDYRNVVNKRISGKYKGISFKYSSKETIKSKYFLGRRFQNFFGLFNGLYLIYKDHKKRKIDAIIFTSTSFWVEFNIYILTRILKITYLKEESEYPYIYFRKGLTRKLSLKLYEKFNYKLYDGLLIISKDLIGYLQTKIRKKASILHVPMTVDFERFKNVAINRELVKTNITYIGTLNFRKDGVDILIKAFAKIVEKYKNIKLCLIGYPESNEIEVLIHNLIKDLNLNNKVILKGRVDSNLIPQLLLESKILVLARPSSLQAQGGFPCKLGEYLATANPVVITDVGEISNYLEDGKSAFIAKSDSVDSFAEKLTYVLEHPKLANEVGIRGKKVALESFNNYKQTQDIINFISQLNNNI